MLKNRNRWWENYLVRYLAGNIFAILVLSYLFINYGDRIGEKFYSAELNKQHIVCKKYKKNKINFTKRVFIFVFEKVETTRHGDINVTAKRTTEISFVSLLIIGLFSFLYMYISSIPIYFFHIVRFGSLTFENYKKSANIRDNSKNCRKPYIYCDISPTYIESYKHIREHGNAFGIILMEILFAGYLICTNFSIFGLLLWVSIGFFGWFLGIWLEQKMVDETYEGLWFTLPIFLFLIFVIMLFCFHTSMA